MRWSTRPRDAACCLSRSCENERRPARVSSAGGPAHNTSLAAGRTRARREESSRQETRDSGGA
eukprot:3855854-Prymnesium_polylepis.1